MDITELRKQTALWKHGYFIIYEEDGLIVGFYESDSGFDSKNSIFIDSPYSDRKREDIEDELNSLIAGTCFRRNEEDDVFEGKEFALAFEAKLDSPDFHESIRKIMAD